MAYYKDEFDPGVVVDEKTGKITAMLTIRITLAEYRDLVAKAAKNDAARLSDYSWTLRVENEKLRAELADLRKKLEDEKEAAE